MAYSAQARRNMVTNQLEPSGVTSATVINAIEAVPREDFVPGDMQEAAYLDEDIRLDEERYVMEPRVFAKIMQAAEIIPEHKVLDVACGTGYSTAVIAELSDHVVAVESNGELAELARRNLRKRKKDIKLFCASIAGGYTLQAPYDRIFINGAIEVEPTELLDQLSVGGQLFAVQVSANTDLKSRSATGKLTCWTRGEDDLFHKTELFDAALPLLSDFSAKEVFEF